MKEYLTEIKGEWITYNPVVTFIERNWIKFYYFAALLFLEVLYCFMITPYAVQNFLNNIKTLEAVF